MFILFKKQNISNVVVFSYYLPAYKHTAFSVKDLYLETLQITLPRIYPYIHYNVFYQEFNLRDI